MIRFFIVLASIFLLIFSWPTLKNIDYHKAIDSIKSEIENVKKNKDLQAAIDSGTDKVQQFLNRIDTHSSDQPQADSSQSKNISLKTPSNQLFSINNIELGDSKDDIEHRLGPAKRSSLNEYGAKWYAYHKDYQQFFMVMYDNNRKVTGLYTDQALIASTKGIKLGISKEKVRAKLGTPLSGLQKGLIIYQFQKNSDYDMYLLDGVYVTLFYDKHEGNTVTALQLISQNVEQKKKDYFTKASSALEKGFEYQLFDLTNSSRVKHHLLILSWDQHVRGTARNHSLDMAENQYFDHTNLKGQSPFDRMNQDHITFLLAGENIAYGQLSSIFAHEGLMNSLGHRENILRKDYKYLGVGVAFSNESQPYYTEDFYAK
ncbi:CAP domain-containing protein [Heyndrickxia sp. NPDC080065]|uniref:CAP domain-containing protein n=1 Tax=Heyndrickxia sp. NPDC080065 TaxID=3390568 RepID=UPI003CFE1900